MRFDQQLLEIMLKELEPERTDNGNGSVPDETLAANPG